MDKELRIIELDPDVWLRGGDVGGVLLRQIDGRRRQCCIGVACTAFGVADEVIDTVGCVVDLEVTALPGPLMQLAEIVDESGDWVSDYERIKDDGLTAVYRLNDAAEITDDDERIARINAELAEADASFRFALKVA
jgi:hypothetical protein